MFESEVNDGVYESKRVSVTKGKKSKEQQHHTETQNDEPFASDLPQCLVVGATDDFIVDEVSTMETAAYYAVNPVYIDSSHDVMYVIIHSDIYQQMTNKFY